jgi:hypothetical protein
MRTGNKLKTHSLLGNTSNDGMIFWIYPDLHIQFLKERQKAALHGFTPSHDTPKARSIPEHRASLRFFRLRFSRICMLKDLCWKLCSWLRY